MTKPPAFVLRLGPAGLTLVRALGRHGVPVVVLHSDARDPAARSRYARTRLLPSLEEHEASWVDALLEEGRRLDSAGGVIFPIGDQGWLFLARHRDTLGRYFRFALPEGRNLVDWPSKSFQYRVAVSAGLPVPRTLFPEHEEDVAQAVATIGLPCVLKPIHSHAWSAAFGWEKLVLVTTPDEALTRWRDAAQRGLTVLVQEHIAGGDDQLSAVHAYLDRDGRPLAAGVVRKIRQYPPHFGAGCFSASGADREADGSIREMGLTMLQAMRFHGIGAVEFKRNARTGELKLIEANVRIGTMTAALIDDGLNFPYIAYRDLLGYPLPVPGSPRGGRKVVLLGRDARSFRYYQARGELTWWRWIRSLLGRTREYYFAWDDLRPFAHQLRRYVRGWLD